MARFLEGNYQRNKIRARPVNSDWRSKIPWFYKRWVFPYLPSSPLKFYLEILEQAPDVGEVYLPHLDIKVHWPQQQHTENYSSIDRYNTDKHGKFGEYNIPYAGVIEIWAGTPYKGGSVILVQAEAFDLTTIVVSIIATVLTTGFLALLGFLASNLTN